MTGPMTKYMPTLRGAQNAPTFSSEEPLRGWGKGTQGTVAWGRSAVSGCVRWATVLAASLLLAHGTAARAHESEQYTLPAGRDFADLGPQLSRSFVAAIRVAVARTNAAIDAALDDDASSSRLQSLQSASHVAAQVWGSIFTTYPINELLDLGLISPATQARYPGLVTMYRPVQSIYDDPLLVLDVSKAVRTFFRAGTISAGGMLIGTDKVIHFINIGRVYHVHYLAAIDRGLSEPDAALEAVRATARNRLTSEDGVLGRYTTGIRSNGDLAADYAGLKFYRNLTEPVRIGATLRPAMLQRDGPHWRVVVSDEDRVFTAFVTPHWNEVLNPNTYLGYVGERVRSVIGERCDDVSDWYRDGRGQAHDSAWFLARQQELATFYGEPYGHKLDAQRPVSVATICGPAPSDGSTARAQPPGPGTQLWWAAVLPAERADALGRSALWWAAAAGDDATVDRLTASGTAIDVPDLDGETALHAAARQGHANAVQLLLARGADANRAGAHGASPLLLAVTGGDADTASILLRAGANPNAQDRFGRTALQEVAQRGDLQLALLLLRHGADATLASHHGRDALQIARRSGNDNLLATLRASAPVVRRLGPADGERGAAVLVAVPLPDAAPDSNATVTPKP